MSFDQGIIQQNTVFKWDGKKRELLDWNQDQTPKSWLKYSAVWVSQRLTPQLGYARIKQYLAKFQYGNQDFSGDPGKDNGLTHTWLSSSLKISAMEQLHFLNAMVQNSFPVSHAAITQTKENLYQGKLENGANYYGKTGTGWRGRSHDGNNSGKIRDGWYVGFIESGAEQCIFVSNLSDKQAPAPTDRSYGSQVLKPITVKLLNDYFDS